MAPKRTEELIRGMLISLVRLYQLTLSLFFGPCCRFTPSCSSYTREAIERFGIQIGVRLSVKRVLKCHPFHPGGYDPVPEIGDNS
jgi:hypothetical protein